LLTGEVGEAGQGGVQSHGIYGPAPVALARQADTVGRAVQDRSCLLSRGPVLYVASLLSPHEEATMPSSFEASMADDDLSRQRRKRQARLLDRPVPDFPALTVADIVADVLAASDEGHAPLDVPGYLTEHGHSSTTIETVVAYLQGTALRGP
jgi:hypothetical protein